MDKLPRKQQEYFDNLKKAISTGDEEMYSDLVRNKNPLALREDLSMVLGQDVAENFDDPLNIFKKKELLKEVPITYTENLPKGISGQYVKEHGLFLPKPSDNKLKDLGVKLHELGHKNDELSGLTVDDVFDKSNLKKLGAEAADEAFSKHHGSGFFEKDAINKLRNNKLLSTLAPFIKATGVGAAGLALAGAGNKAMAGDLSGAASDVGELGYDIVEPPVLSAAAPTMMGNSELPKEELEKRAKFNLLRKRLGE